MNTFLGIDGGGSSTRALLTDETGRLLGEGLGGPSNLLSVGSQVATESLDRAVSGAWEAAGLSRDSASVACLGMAGMVGSAQKQQYEQVAGHLRIGKDLVVVSDLDIALTGGLGGGAGIVLISGTGSSCLGRDVDGRTAQAGGKGALAGDSGSGYWIGLRALRTAVKQMDGRLDPSPLLTEVLEFLEIAGPDQLVERIYTRGLPTTDLAGLAPRVMALSLRGEMHAQAIIRDACLALADMAEAVRRKLDLAQPEIVLSGGVALAGAFRGQLETTLAHKLGPVRLVERRLPPVAGAVLQALQRFGIDPSVRLLENLEKAGS